MAGCHSSSLIFHPIIERPVSKITSDKTSSTLPVISNTLRVTLRILTLEYSTECISIGKRETPWMVSPRKERKRPKMKKKIAMEDFLPLK